MKKCIQFSQLSEQDREKVLRMAKLTPAFWVVSQCEEFDESDMAWLLDQTAEHFTHMNTISGGKYGEFTELDF